MAHKKSKRNIPLKTVFITGGILLILTGIFFWIKTQQTLYSVVRVIDGDTIVVNINGKNETVRTIGDNSPEPGECFSQQATLEAKRLLENKKVRLKPDPNQGERDIYTRLLRYVFLPGGANFSQVMITEGFAKEYTFITPYKYQVDFKQAEQIAKESNRGLWSACK